MANDDVDADDNSEADLLISGCQPTPAETCFEVIGNEGMAIIV